jgi:antitoxin YefM
MPAIRLSEDVKPISDLKSRASAIVNHVRQSHRPLLLTRRGQGVAVLLDVEEYERLVERAEFIEAISEGMEAAARGDIVDHAEAQKILDSFGTNEHDV